MFQKIRSLGADTAIYGTSTILGRFLTFLLTPLYANILPPGDLGIVATLYAYIAFLNVVYNYGMDTAYMKHVSTLELGDQRQTFSVPFLSVTASSLLFSGLIVIAGKSSLSLIHLPEAHESVLSYAALILLLDTVALVPFASLRMDRKAARFAAIKLTGIVINVVCTVILLIRYRMGVEGIFLAGVVSSGATVLLLIPTIISRLGFRFPPNLFRSLLSFGLPTVPAGLAAMVIQVIDRPILEALTDKTTVGVYQANYRLGIFMMLIVSMFDFAWRPFFFTYAKDPEAKNLFARVLTYFLLLMTVVFLILGFFLEEIVKAPIFFGYSILPSPYWPGLSIVPVILLAYMFLGMSNNFAASVYIEKRTKKLPLVTFLGAAVNVAANLLLIPPLGIMGAALATLLSYAVMAGMMLVISQRVYPVRYEHARLLKIASAAILVYAIHLIVQPMVFAVLWKILLVGLFLFLIHRMNVFHPSELSAFGRLFAAGKASHDESRVPVDPEI